MRHKGPRPREPEEGGEASWLVSLDELCIVVVAEQRRRARAKKPLPAFSSRRNRLGHGARSTGQTRAPV